MYDALRKQDPEIAALVDGEQERQRPQVQLWGWQNLHTLDGNRAVGCAVGPAPFPNWQMNQCREQGQCDAEPPDDGVTACHALQMRGEHDTDKAADLV